MAKFNFIELDKTVLPKTKGMRVDVHRFYNINGKNYPSVTVLGIRKTEQLKEWRQKIGEDVVANWEMGRLLVEVNLFIH